MTHHVNDFGEFEHARDNFRHLFARNTAPPPRFLPDSDFLSCAVLHGDRRLRTSDNTLVRETTRALGGGCSLRSYCFILPIDGAVPGAVIFATCVKMVSPPMRFFNRVSASYLSARAGALVHRPSGLD